MGKFWQFFGEIGCLPYFYTCCGLSANLGCRYETCCTRLAENTVCKKSPKIRQLRTIVQICRDVSLQLRQISTVRKNLLSSNISSTCPHNIVTFSPVAAEIGSVVWGTPANFDGFRVLAALLHCTPVVGVSQTVASNRGRHLYSAGWPSPWAAAHILVFVHICWCYFIIDQGPFIVYFSPWLPITYISSHLTLAMSVRYLRMQ